MGVTLRRTMQWEALVAYGVVDQLLRVAGVRATGVLLARERALSAEEPVSVGAAILELLGDRDEESPVVLVVDDAHWADVDSLRALLFALRRLVADRVLTLLVARTEDSDRLPEGLRRIAGGQSGATLSVGPLDTGDMQALAAAMGAAGFSIGATRYTRSHRGQPAIRDHTGGNPLYASALLTEVPPGRWRDWEPTLPAPREFSAHVVRRLRACPDAAQRLLEAASVLGARGSLAMAAELGGVADPLAALEVSSAAGLLLEHSRAEVWEIAFTHPLVQAAIYDQLGAVLRTRLHLAAADLVQDQGARLRHRVAATAMPDAALAAELERFARREGAIGAWGSAASGFLEASRLSPTRAERERRRLEALDAMVTAGDLVKASPFADQVIDVAPGALRDSALGYLAVISGRPAQAAELLQRAWQQCDPVADAHLAAVVAHRLALDAIGQLRGQDVVHWASRAAALAAPADAIWLDVEALHGVGLAWIGRGAEGVETVEAALRRMASADWAGLPLRMAHGWLGLVADDVAGVRPELTETASTSLRLGSFRAGVWAYVWLTRADYYAGAWDEAMADAEHALALLVETEHEWLRPLVRWAATAVPAARGEWRTAEEHARLAASGSNHYPIMLAASGLAQAEVSAARGDHQAVLRSLEPLRQFPDRRGIDAPGFWPWPELYGDALVSAGRVEEADAFLQPHETKAAECGRRSAMARPARVRGRIEAARSRGPAAEAAFQRGLAELDGLPMPFELALIELAYGQALRRLGQRRAAAARLGAARERLAALEARPSLERCDRELVACGLSPPQRRTFDRSRLTPQELAVARRVAAGRSNRQVASELVVSVKTVQFHLTHIYTKLGLTSRTELAARLRDDREHRPPTPAPN